MQVIRFYLPALGLMALLATWLLTKLRAWITWPLIAGLVVAALLSFGTMSNSHSLDGGGFGGPAGGSPPERLAREGGAPPGGVAP